MEHNDWLEMNEKADMAWDKLEQENARLRARVAECEAALAEIVEHDPVRDAKTGAVRCSEHIKAYVRVKDIARRALAGEGG